MTLAVAKKCISGGRSGCLIVAQQEGSSHNYKWRGRGVELLLAGLITNMGCGGESRGVA